MKLPVEFYRRKDVVKIARDLLGKGLFTIVNGVKIGGVIVETEAYSWTERGSHAYGAKKTDRNAIMFQPGGFSYVYLCYGIHNLFNVVTNKEDAADAVLIRALEPTDGVEEMKKLRGKIKSQYQLTSGPGKLTKALGINRTFNGKSLVDSDIWLEDLKNQIPSKDIIASPRIGIDYAGEDANLPWRFTIRGSKWISQ